MAASENPDAQIIYKPHPEVIRGTRHDSSHSSPRDVEHIADVIYEDISLADALDTVDHVYTITSLSGFEALLRGIRCTCLGRLEERRLGKEGVSTCRSWLVLAQ